MINRGALWAQSRLKGRHRIGIGGARSLQRMAWAALEAREVWWIGIAGFLCGRAGIDQAVYPFGLAFFWTILRSGQRKHAAVAGGAVLLGMLTSAPTEVLLAAVVIMIAGAALFTPAAEAARSVVQHVWGQAFVAGGLYTGIRMLFTQLLGAATANPVWLAFESLLIAGSILVWQPLSQLRLRVQARQLDREAWISLGLLLVMLSLGLKGIQLGPVDFGELWNRLITLGAALLGGVAAGATVGTAVAWVAGMGGDLIFGHTMVFAVAGLLAGLFSGRGKLGIAFGFVLGHLLFSLQTVSSREIVAGLLHAGLSVGVLALVPHRWLRRVESLIPGSRANERLVKVREDHLRQAVSERLRDVGHLLHEMGKGFEAVNAPETRERGDEGMSAFVSHLEQSLCRTCRSYEHCWKERPYQTFWEIVEFLSRAEDGARLDVEDMPPTLRTRCKQSRALAKASQESLRQLQVKERWRRQIEEQKRAVPRQLKGIADLINRLADQVRVETGRSEEVELMLHDALRSRRIPVHRVHVRPLGGEDRFDIVIERVECLQHGDCSAGIEELVSGVLGHPYELWSHEPSSGDGHPCRLRLARRPLYKLTTAVTSIAKRSEEVSGDASATVHLLDGRVAVILSDGMGSGSRAAMESQATVQLLARLLEAGFDLSFAVQCVNSFLLVRSTEESFATVDVALIDQFTGEVDFIKVGSAPSFIKRGGEVDIIRSSSLPVGILSDVEVRPLRRRLAPGDMVILITDGVMDSVDRTTDREEWVSRVLRRGETDDPRALVRVILERVRQVAGDDMADDVSVAVLRLDPVDDSPGDRTPSPDGRGEIPAYRREMNTVAEGKTADVYLGYD